MSQQPQRISHELDDFSASGIYPGGTNIITDAGYVLWDYGGSMPPNSNCAMKITCQPTDGSNENKPHDIYWNVGPASDFAPEGDGAFMMGNRPPSQQCNWFFALSKFRDNCGLEKGKLSGEKGVKALIGSEVTFIRVPHEREAFKDQAPQIDPATGKPKQKQSSNIIIPSKARFAWEAGRKGAATPVKAPVAGAAATAPVNGAGGSAGDPLHTALAAILSENDNAIELKDLAPKVVEKLSLAGIGAAQRVKFIKTVNDVAKLTELATANGWTVDAAEGVLLIA
jgi:hypothetical protein